MALRLCSQHNMTWGLEEHEKNSDFYFNKDTQRFEGGMFEIIKTRIFLRSKKENFDEEFYRHCSFKVFKNFGDKLPNSSYDGALGELINSRIDASFKPGDFFMDQRLVGFTHPIYNSPYHTMQFIDNERILKEKGVSDQVLSVFIPSVNFCLEYVFFLIVGLLIRVYLLRLSLRGEHKKLTLSNLLSASFAEKIAFKKVNFFSVFFVAFAFYVFLLQLLLSNNIKTNKVVVDLSDFITSREQLLTTKKTACFLEDTKTNDFFKFAPNGTLAAFVYRTLTDPDDKCFLVKGISLNSLKKNLNNYVIFLFDTLNLTINILKNFYSANVFVSETSFFDNLFTIYIRKDLPKRIRNYLDACFMNIMASGHMKGLFSGLALHFDRSFPSRFAHYYSVKSFVDEFSYASDLAYNDFKYVLYLCFLLDLLAFSLFILGRILEALEDWL